MKKLGIVCYAAVLALVAPPVQAYQKVGNGDDGGDLEALTALTSGPIVDARAKAVVLLEKLGTSGIRTLGALAPEVERTELFLVTADKQANPESDQGAFHTDMNGRVYARTFAQPHAATRFFPIAITLTQDQLVALHIHEGLHRSLPEHVRENEAKVSQITLAINAPGASRDQVQSVVDQVVPHISPLSRPSDGYTAHYQLSGGRSDFRRISNLSYSYRVFLKGQDTSAFPIRSMHVLQSDLYPFGNENTPFGMGIEASMIDSSAAGLQAGPLGLSARLRIWERSGFDVGLWAVASLNMLSADELNNSPYGRSIYTAGIFIRMRTPVFYIENFLSSTFPGETKQTIGLVDYRYEYGRVINAKIRAGINFQAVDIGVFGEVHLAEYFRVSGGAFTPFDKGAYRLVSVGPELTFRYSGWAASFFGRAVINATQGANLDYLGNLMGAGAAQGSIGMGVSYAF
jgi:hypothetical protein